MRSPLPFRRLCVTAIAAAFAAAQTGAPAVNVARMRSDLEYLCSKELGGRLSLSPGAELAAEYIGREFEKPGLAPAVPGGGFLQKFTLVAPVGTSHASLAITREGSQSDFRPGIDFRTRYWRAADIKAPVVFAGYGITAPEHGYDDYAGIDVKGRAVLVFDHEPEETDPHSVFNGTGHSRWALLTVKREIARRHGAAALILVSEPLRKHAGAFDPLPSDDGKSSLRAMAPRQALDEETIPIILVTDRTAAELLRATGRSPSDLQRAIDERARPASMAVAGTEVEFSMAAAEVRRGESANAAGVLEGADPELRGETVLISAHYDHLGTQKGSVYPGANDNASGTVAVMELARLFAKGAGGPGAACFSWCSGRSKRDYSGPFITSRIRCGL